jgi:hypothetical protein
VRYRFVIDIGSMRRRRSPFRRQAVRGPPSPYEETLSDRTPTSTATTARELPRFGSFGFQTVVDTYDPVLPDVHLGDTHLGMTLQGRYFTVVCATRRV